VADEAPTFPSGPLGAILRAIRTRLLGQTAAAARVFTNRTEALQHLAGGEDDDSGGELPCILVRLGSEDGTRKNPAAARYENTANFAVEVIVSRTGFEAGVAAVGMDLSESESDALTDLVWHVKGLILSDPRLEKSSLDGAPLVADTRYTRTDFAFDSKGEQPLGSAVVNFQCDYSETFAHWKTTRAAPFEKAHTDWQAAGTTPPPDGERTARDEVAVPQV